MVDVHDLYAMLTDVAVQERDGDALREYTPILEEKATSLEHKLYLATAHRAWGLLHRMEGEFKEAKRRLEEAAALFQGLDTRWQLGLTHLELAEVASERSDRTEANQQYLRALELFEELGAVPFANRARRALT